MTRTFINLAATVLSIGLINLGVASAVSPAAIEQGQRMFEHEWSMNDPRLGNDGLGPLFNAKSCVACHHQGGVGGGGETEFNAKTVGIERMEITGDLVNNDVLVRMVRLFHPGFVQTDGTVVNTLAIAHHGGSPRYDLLRRELLSKTGARFSEHGGPVNAEETRLASAETIQFQSKFGSNQISIQARIFHRNTTSTLR